MEESIHKMASAYNVPRAAPDATAHVYGSLDITGNSSKFKGFFNHVNLYAIYPGAINRTSMERLDSSISMYNHKKKSPFNAYVKYLCLLVVTFFSRIVIAMVHVFTPRFFPYLRGFVIELSDPAF